MEGLRAYQILTCVSFFVLFPFIHCWGNDGHVAVCRIAQVFLVLYYPTCVLSVSRLSFNFFWVIWFMLCFQSRLSEAAADAVKQLLPESADNDLGSVCTWADHVKFHYHWSSALHFIDTPDNLCTYQYNSKPKDLQLKFNSRLIDMFRILMFLIFRGLQGWRWGKRKVRCWGY